jgi:hypothetical protein
METFVGLEVSLKDTSVCILDQTGSLVFEGKVVSEPKAMAPDMRVPTQSSRAFRSKPAGDSDAKQPPIPRQASRS